MFAFRFNYRPVNTFFFTCQGSRPNCDSNTPLVCLRQAVASFFPFPCRLMGINTVPYMMTVSLLGTPTRERLPVSVIFNLTFHL